MVDIQVPGFELDDTAEAEKPLAPEPPTKPAIIFVASHWDGAIFSTAC
jgi:hypothetical protein